MFRNVPQQQHNPPTQPKATQFVQPGPYGPPQQPNIPTTNIRVENRAPEPPIYRQFTSEVFPGLSRPPVQSGVPSFKKGHYDYLRSLYENRHRQIIQDLQSKHLLSSTNNQSVINDCFRYAKLYYRREKYVQLLELLGRRNMKSDQLSAWKEYDERPNPIHVMQAENRAFQDMLGLFKQANEELEAFLQPKPST